VPTVSCGFSLRKFFSPRPRTFISSSIFLKGPFLLPVLDDAGGGWWRRTPGSASKSEAGGRC
jgi:hypothetical protein